MAVVNFQASVLGASAASGGLTTKITPKTAARGVASGSGAFSAAPRFFATPVVNPLGSADLTATITPTASPVANPLGSGSLSTKLRREPMSGRGRVLRSLNRVFDRSPDAVLAFEIQGERNLRWRISEPAALEPRVLEVYRDAAAPLIVQLEGQTIAAVRDQLAAAGVSILFPTDDPEILLLGALALVPGGGEQTAAGGDLIFARKSLLWAWADPVGRWLDQARLDLAEMLRSMVVRQSGEGWSELWASYFGLRRRGAETDAALNKRTAWEWRRQRSNPKAIELNIRVLLGAKVRVREPWQEMTVVSGAVASGGDHLPNEEEFAYHRMQLTSPDAVDWGAVMEEAEADRPAGTLYLPPMTMPQAWIEVPHAYAVDFAAETVLCDRLEESDGQIISVTWSVSDTFVMLNPVFALDELLTYTTEERDVGGDLFNRRTNALAAIVLDDQGRIGDLQARLSGAVRFEEGEPMRASGAPLGTYAPGSRTNGLSDYVHRLTDVPVDEWLEDTQAGSSNVAPVYPPQTLIVPEVSISGFADHGDSTLEWSRQDVIYMPAPSFYSGGWTGLWDDRPWIPGFPQPVIEMSASAFGENLAGNGSAITTGRGALRIGSRFAAVATAVPSGSGTAVDAGAFFQASVASVASRVTATLRIGAQMSASAGVVPTGTASLRLGVLLASQAAASATVGATGIASGPLANASSPANTGGAANLGATPASGGARLSP